MTTRTPVATLKHTVGCRASGSCRGKLTRSRVRRTYQKHGIELQKMNSPAHTDLIPLVETALAVMRLSCERFFVLVSVFAAYLIYHGRVPRWFRRLIGVIHRLSKLFQQVSNPHSTLPELLSWQRTGEKKRCRTESTIRCQPQVILNTFPAVCWLYGAGAIFSTFVSLVFWGASARRLYTYARDVASIVQPLGLQASLSLLLTWTRTHLYPVDACPFTGFNSKWKCISGGTFKHNVDVDEQSTGMCAGVASMFGSMIRCTEGKVEVV